MARTGWMNDGRWRAGAVLASALLGLIGAQGCGQILGITEVQGTGPGGGGATTVTTGGGAGGGGGASTTTGHGGNGGNGGTTTTTTGTGGAGGGECDAPGDCPGSSSDCRTITCVQHLCGVSNAGAGTLLGAASQLPHDCKALVCDGDGNVSPTPAVDDGDLPDDNNDCTTDTCSGGVPQFTNKGAGSPCGNGQACNAAGQCGCANDSQCVPPATCGGGNPGLPNVCGCTKKTCAGVGATCGLVSDGCSGMLACDDGQKNGTETDVDCGGGCAAKCATGKQCAVAGDCQSAHCADGICCTSDCTATCSSCAVPGGLGACTKLPAGQPDPNGSAPCTGQSACDGAGLCKKQNAQICAASSECASAHCTDGVCCSSTCASKCKACNLPGSVGTCDDVPSGQPDPGTCAAPSVCDGGGSCLAPTGAVCNQSDSCLSNHCADGYCCNVSCSTTCMQCNQAGKLGVCTNIAQGQPDTSPANACSGTSACNGSGLCKKASGQPCSLGSECASGICTGGNLCQ